MEKSREEGDEELCRGGCVIGVEEKKGGRRAKGGEEGRRLEEEREGTFD